MSGTGPERGGTWFVVPTPFAPDGSLDLESQGRVVEAAIAWGVDGLTVMGVTSEAGALTPDEREAALRRIFQAAAGEVPVAAGCSAPGVAAAAGLARRAREFGAAAAMVSAPPLHRDVETLPAFFAAVAREGGLTLVVQDEPAATGVVMPVGTLLAATEASRATVVKLEDPPTPPKIAALLAARPDLRVFGGLGGVAALSELRRGACGTMTGFAFPEILREVRVALAAGERRRAAAVFDAYLPLIQLEAQPRVGLTIRKELLLRRGVIAAAGCRVARPPDAVTLDEIGEVLDRVGVSPGPERLVVRGG